MLKISLLSIHSLAQIPPPLFVPTPAGPGCGLEAEVGKNTPQQPFSAHPIPNVSLGNIQPISSTSTPNSPSLEVSTPAMKCPVEQELQINLLSEIFLKKIGVRGNVFPSMKSLHEIALEGHSGWTLSPLSVPTVSPLLVSIQAL